MRRVVAAVVSVALALLPANLGAGTLPPYNGCHGELSIESYDGRVVCLFATNHLYQRYTYFVRAYSKAYVCRIEVVELRHGDLGKESAEHSGIKDPDSVKRYYRNEYSNRTQLLDPNGVVRDAFIDVWSGPDGLLVEVLTLIPIEQGPTMEDETTQQAMVF